ncbi:hypothetical protein LZ30DRAFT_26453 [Colletotrichum cereale]|nr:hypothetical protein LZ30DRAFT_26453 [Colletotrichum cereale]
MIQGLTGNDRQHLQRDVKLGLARNVYDCAGEPVTISGHLTIPSHTSVCSSSQRSSGRKRVNEDSNIGNDSEDEEFGKANKRQNRGGTTESPTTKFFSCPYFKKDPVRHLKCFMRFKLKRVKDVKQHLYRKHSLSEHCCPSCWATFDCRSDWDDHIRNRSCQAKEMPEKYGDFMTVDQKKAISRRTDGGLDEHKQWYNVWGVLFPHEVPPASPYLKSRELEELIPIVRWFWEKNSFGIVSNILSSSRTTTVPEPTNASPTEDGRVIKVDEEARRLTHTMDILLNRVEESIQSSRRRVSSPTQSSLFTPSPLLSNAGILESMEDGLTTFFVPKIEVNEPQDDQSASQHPTVGDPPGLSDTDFWIHNVIFGLPSTEYPESLGLPGSCEDTESFKPE